MKKLITQLIKMKTPCSIQHPTLHVASAILKNAALSSLSLSHLPLLLCLPSLEQKAQDLAQYLCAQAQLITASQMDTEVLTACREQQITRLWNVKLACWTVAVLHHIIHTLTFKLPVTWDLGVWFTGRFMKIFCYRKYHYLFHQEMNVKYCLQKLSRPYTGLSCKKIQPGYRWDTK